MSGSDKLFDKLFPSTALLFDTSLTATALWKGRQRNWDVDRAWHIALSADILLIRAASYRETFDLFTRPKFWAELYLLSQLSEGENGMATKGQRKQEDRAAWKGFLECRLTEEQLVGLDEWRPKPAEVFLTVDEMMADDYRLTLSYNKRTKLASCTLIDDSPSRKSGGWAISTADENGAAALKGAVYKHRIVLEGSWLSLLDTPPKSRRG